MFHSNRKKGGKKGGKACLLLAFLMVSLGAQAQNFVYESLLNVKALSLGTNTTAGSITNIVQWPGMIHQTNSAWTNLSGALITVGTNQFNTSTNTWLVANTINPITTFPLFRDAPFWYDREGRMPLTWVNSLNPTGSTGTNVLIQSGQTLFIRGVSVGGTNGAYTIVFNPYYTVGSSPITTAYANTTTNVDDWTVTFVASASSGEPTKACIFTTNCPTYLWPGAAGLRVKRIVPVSVSADVTIITNRFFFTEIGITGFKP